MARHRNVRTLNYDEEYDTVFDVYGQSVEDESCCISPTTAAEFMYDRNSKSNQSMSAFLSPEAALVLEEEEEEDDDHSGRDRTRADSISGLMAPLNQLDRAKLQSCVEEMQNVVGDTITESQLATAAMQHNFNLEEALASVLSKIGEDPKPQRVKKERPPREKELDCHDHSSRSPSHKGSSTGSHYVTDCVGRGFKNSPSAGKGLLDFNPLLNNILPPQYFIKDHQASESDNDIVRGPHADVRDNKVLKEMSLSELAQQHISLGTRPVQNMLLSTPAIGFSAGSPSSLFSVQNSSQNSSLCGFPAQPVSSISLNKSFSSNTSTLSKITQQPLSSLLHQANSSTISPPLGQSFHSDLTKKPLSKLLHCSDSSSVSPPIPAWTSLMSSDANKSVPHFYGSPSRIVTDVPFLQPQASVPSLSLAEIANQHLSSLPISDEVKTNPASVPTPFAATAQHLSLAEMASQHLSSLPISKPEKANRDHTHLSHSGTENVQPLKQHAPFITVATLGSKTLTLGELAQRHLAKQSTSASETVRARTPPPSDTISSSGESSIPQIPVTKATDFLPDCSVDNVSLFPHLNETINEDCNPEESSSLFIHTVPSSKIIPSTHISASSFQDQLALDFGKGNAVDPIDVSDRDLGPLLLNVSSQTSQNHTLEQSLLRKLDTSLLKNSNSVIQPIKQLTQIETVFTGPGASQDVDVTGKSTPPVPDWRTIFNNGAFSIGLNTPPASELEAEPSTLAFAFCRRLKVLHVVANGEIKDAKDLLRKTGLKCFNFQSPSPDDIIKMKQQGKAVPEIEEEKKVPENEMTTQISVTGIQGERLSFGPEKPGTQEVVTPQLEVSKTSEPKKLLETGERRERKSRSPSPIPNGRDAGGIDITGSTRKSKQANKNPVEEYTRERGSGKPLLNLVVIGHVDAGKSTLMGHLLYRLGCVTKRAMHKYEQDSKKLGKASFMYAWVLDETSEERNRGITMDVAQSKFETSQRSVTLLDAPGHKDFIPNMITGAAQADVAILVVDATRGEFETGFEAGGQTREHTVLVRSLGVSQLAVVVNKLDNVSWSEDRYREIELKLSTFLKQVGFKESDIFFVPCSGLTGENLTDKTTNETLSKWYSGPCLVDVIDGFRPPERPISKPFRISIGDIFKGTGAGFCVGGRIESGHVVAGDRILVMPAGEPATIKSIMIDEMTVPQAFAGDHVTLSLSGVDQNKVAVGDVACDSSQPIRASNRFHARVVVFNVTVPLTKGFPVILHYQSMNEQAVVRKILTHLHKNTGEILKKKPRCLLKNSSGEIELEVNRPICIELYKDFKELGRFMLRSGGTTVAAGLVTKVL